MAMFGMAAKLAAAKRMRMEQQALGNTERPMAPPREPAPQRSMFGAFGRAWSDPRGRFGVAPERWAQVAAGFHDLSRGTNTLPDVMQQQRENALGDEAMDHQRQNWLREDEDRQRLNAWIASLPPEHQAAARLNPKAYIEAMLRSQGAGDGYEYQNFGRYDPQTGAWEELPGAVDAYRRAHPQSPATGGTDPWE